jgi:hypothetical protein
VFGSEAGQSPASRCRRSALPIGEEMKERIPVFAVLRIDSDMQRDEDRVTVKEIVRSEAEALAEVERLNLIRPDESVRYLWQATRLVR